MTGHKIKSEAKGGGGVGVKTARVYKGFVACMAGCTTKPRFRSWVLWWPHLMNFALGWFMG